MAWSDRESYSGATFRYILWSFLSIRLRTSQMSPGEKSIMSNVYCFSNNKTIGWWCAWWWVAGVGRAYEACTGTRPTTRFVWRILCWASHPLRRKRRCYPECGDIRPICQGKFAHTLQCCAEHLIQTEDAIEQLASFFFADRSASYPSRLLSTPFCFARAYGPLQEYVVTLRPLSL